MLKVQNQEKGEFSSIALPGPDVVMLNRKEVGNLVDYFDKTFAEYKEGFESKGKNIP